MVEEVFRGSVEHENIDRRWHGDFEDPHETEPTEDFGNEGIPDTSKAIDVEIGSSKIFEDDSLLVDKKSVSQQDKEDVRPLSSTSQSSTVSEISANSADIPSSNPEQGVLNSDLFTEDFYPLGELKERNSTRGKSHRSGADCDPWASILRKQQWAQNATRDQREKSAATSKPTMATDS